MKKRLFGIFVLILATVFSLSILGCAVRFQKRHPLDVERIKSLREKLQELQETKNELEAQLQKEITEGSVSLQMQERGLVVTVVAEVLFDSGKAKVRPVGKEVLSKVANVLIKINENIIIEGHTDNVPIKHSGWKSNWELSTQRALNVLHYFIDEKGLNPERFSAAGYGPYRPMASNATVEGRQENRRVEIVVVPAKIKKAREGTQLETKSKAEEYIK